jgi:replicative DNA helicase
MGNVIALDRNRKSAPTLRDPAGRLPPNDTIVEAAVLYRLMSPMLAVDDLHSALRVLCQEHFFNLHNGVVFGAMKELVAEGMTIDVITLHAKLKDVTPTPQGGWMRYLRETIPADGVHAEVSPKEYVRILLDKWRCRETIRVCHATLAEGYDGPDSIALINKARTDLAAVAESRPDDMGTAAGDSLADAWRNLIAVSEMKNRGLSWGWPSCDALFGRLMPARMTVIAAVPGVGKTNAAYHVAESVAAGAEDENLVGDAVYFVSAELRAHDLISRQAGIRAGVHPDALEGARPFTDDEVRRLQDAQKDIAGIPIILDDNGGRPFCVSDIEPRVRAAQARMAAGTYTMRDGRRFGRNRLRLVVVDYLTKMKPPKPLQGHRYDSREREVAAIAEALTDMAKVLNVHVLCIAAVSRGAKQQVGADPRKRELHMSDLRESGVIEYEAANIVFLNVPEPGILRFRTSKQRFREAGEVDRVDLEMAKGRIFEKNERQ